MLGTGSGIGHISLVLSSGRKCFFHCRESQVQDVFLFTGSGFRIRVLDLVLSDCLVSLTGLFTLKNVRTQLVYNSFDKNWLHLQKQKRKVMCCL